MREAGGREEVVWGVGVETRGERVLTSFSPSRNFSPFNPFISHLPFLQHLFSTQCPSRHRPLPTKTHFLPPFHLKFLPQPTSKPYHLRSIRGGANPTTRWSARSLELSATRLPCPRRLLAHSPAPEFLRLPIYRLHREILAQAAAGAAHRLFDFDPRTACVRGLPPGTGAASRLCAAPIAVPVGHRRPRPCRCVPHSALQINLAHIGAF